MRIFRPSASDFVKVEIKGEETSVLSKAAYAKFTPAILGLGDISSHSSSTDAIAAVFDLAGFTRFCGQVEPHLSVPRFLSQFLEWLMVQLKEQSVNVHHEKGELLYSPLPFFVKFTGDGLLVLWDASEMEEPRRRIVMINVREICREYNSKFYLEIKKTVADPPSVLRCGIARGTVYSVGNGTDFVGTCINMAVRLQKLPGITFAMNIRGIPLDVVNDNFYKKHYVIKRVSISGIGENELVALIGEEVDSMKARDRRIYREV